MSKNVISTKPVFTIKLNHTSCLPVDPAALTSALWLRCVGSCFTATASSEKLAQTHDTEYLIYLWPRQSWWGLKLSCAETNVKMKSTENSLDWLVGWWDWYDRNRKDCGLCTYVCSPLWVSLHNGSSIWANRVQRSYHRAWRTFYLRTLVDKFSFQRLEAMKPCPSANGTVDTSPNKENLCRSTRTTTAIHTEVTHMKGGDLNPNAFKP